MFILAGKFLDFCLSGHQCCSLALHRHADGSIKFWDASASKSSLKAALSFSHTIVSSHSITQYLRFSFVSGEFSVLPQAQSEQLMNSNVLI